MRQVCEICEMGPMGLTLQGELYRREGEKEEREGNEGSSHPSSS